MDSLVLHSDVFIHVANLLSLRDIAITRRLNKKWYKKGKKCIVLYEIGLAQNGWSMWEGDKDKVFGWGMRISVDFCGRFRGLNKNNGSHSSTAQLKRYEGNRSDKIYKLDVIFPDTDQINNYEGQIVDGVWKGTFKLVKSCGSRKEGTGGTMEGKVLEC
jgi:hypothetical protein